MSSKQETEIFLRRMGIVLYPEKHLDGIVNCAVAKSLNQGFLNLENLTNLTNASLADLEKQSKDYHHVPLTQKDVGRYLNYMSRHGIVIQERDGNWSLSKSGKEVIDYLVGKPRTREQEEIDLFEVIGSEMLELRGNELRRFVQHRVDDTTETLTQAWENFKTAGNNK